LNNYKEASEIEGFRDFELIRYNGAIARIFPFPHRVDEKASASAHARYLGITC
jgi:hypothetical protein